MSETTFWYFVVEGGGVESGDSMMEMPAGAKTVDTLDALHLAIDEATEQQTLDFESDQNAILLDVEMELSEKAPEPDNPAPIPIRHILFTGMGPSMQGKLKAAGVKTLEQLDELGVDGLVGLEIKGLTEKKAQAWTARAREILARLG